ncbi:hypothetical protein [Azospirillum sp. B4]|uniref:hypothetical protein n=1 Tax=Azospirillum sp. B4 TaxID=95605 RepID=UPI0003452B51|nr:hypothetical protein [Azospirillum sp. B4]
MTTAVDANLAAGFERVTDMVDGQPVTVWAVTCGCCGAVGKVRFKPDFPPAHLTQNFTNKGWDMRGNTRLCPTCSSRKRGPKPAGHPRATTKESPMARIVPSPNTMPMPAPPGISTEARQTALVYDKLRDHFDTGRGVFEDGWNDERIATEVSVPPEFVRKVRDSFGMVLRLPPELAQLDADIKTIQALVAEVLERQTALRRKLGVAA